MKYNLKFKQKVHSIYGSNIDNVVDYVRSHMDEFFDVQISEDVSLFREERYVESCPSFVSMYGHPFGYEMTDDELKEFRESLGHVL